MLDGQQGKSTYRQRNMLTDQRIFCNRGGIFYHFYPFRSPTPASSSPELLGFLIGNFSRSEKTHFSTIFHNFYVRMKIERYETRICLLGALPDTCILAMSFIPLRCSTEIMANGLSMRPRLEGFAFPFSINNKDILIPILVLFGQVGDTSLSLSTCTRLEEVAVLATFGEATRLETHGSNSWNLSKRQKAISPTQCKRDVYIEKFLVVTGTEMVYHVFLCKQWKILPK